MLPTGYLRRGVMHKGRTTLKMRFMPIGINLLQRFAGVIRGFGRNGKDGKHVPKESFNGTK